MSNKPTLKTKIPYVDNNNAIEDVVSYMAKTLNSSFLPSISDLLPLGSILQSIYSEDVFKSQVGSNWSQIGTTVISGITINIFQKIN